MEKRRIEKDSLGPVEVPADAYYGAQTQRAVENFAISGLRLPPEFIRALALIKKEAAEVNGELGWLAGDVSEAIARAAREVMEGRMADQFVVDVFQTGSATSTNMNMNEVLAGRANEILTGRRGGKFPVHPNDHVNLGQSSNDVIPTALHVAAWTAVRGRLIPALSGLRASLARKAEEFSDVVKIGRTHLQDAVVMTLGDEFSGYARQVDLGIRRLESTGERLEELALGGTAVGTGVNTHPEFAQRVIARLNEATGLSFREAANHFEAQAAQDAAVEASGALRTVAVSLIKIANDIRWLGSGPRCGIGEIRLPALQPGSSIMPGKVNPVISEAVIQVGVHVLGNDATVAACGQWGFFELNTMLPVMAYNLLQSVEILAAAADVFRTRCVDGIEADRERCRTAVEQSLAMATYLVPRLGYDRAAEIAKAAYEQGKTVREAAIEGGWLSREEVEQALATLIPGRKHHGTD